jgi:protein-tyrosine-phosphatase
MHDNSARSQMAGAFMRKYDGDQLEVFCARLEKSVPMSEFVKKTARMMQ